MEKKIEPQFIPIKCPTCQGHTTVNWGKDICKTCLGKGYIPVPPKEDK